MEGYAFLFNIVTRKMSEMNTDCHNYADNTEIIQVGLTKLINMIDESAIQFADHIYLLILQGENLDCQCLLSSGPCCLGWHYITTFPKYFQSLL